MKAVTFLVLSVSFSIGFAQSTADVQKKLQDAETVIRTEVQKTLPKKEADGQISIRGQKIRLGKDRHDIGMHGTTIVKGHQVTVGVAVGKGLYGSTPIKGGPVLIGIGLGGTVHAEAPIAGQNYAVGTGLMDIKNNFDSGYKAGKVMAPTLQRTGNEVGRQARKIAGTVGNRAKQTAKSLSKKVAGYTDQIKRIW